MTNDDHTPIPWGKIALWLFLAIVIGLALDWIYAGQNFFLYRYWAPRQADVQRNVYTHTRSYRQGSVQRLNTICMQITEADNDHKSMLNSVVADEFADWNTKDVPDYLRGCLVNARARDVAK